MQEYQRLKYEIFGREFSWPINALPGTGRAELDPFDTPAHFVIARTIEGSAIGCARAMALKVGFPHQQLLAPLLQQLGRDQGECGTLNSVAISRRWRGRAPDGAMAKSPDTVAAMIVQECHAHFLGLGLSTCVLTTTEIVADRFFSPLGYVASGSPFSSGMYSASLVNMHRALR